MRLIQGLVHLLVRLIVLPIKLAFALVGGTFRVGVKVGGAPARVGWRATRAAGVSGVVCFVLGLVLGLLFAPGPGRELRAKLRRLADGGAGLSDEELADRVAFELGHAPRTWHLPQPEVAVVAGRVSLMGSVPHDTARDELVRVAAAIPGVAAVDDQLQLETTASPGE
jgi:hypothetical protein